MNEARKVHVTLGVFWITARKSWNNAALVFEDQTGDKAPRKVTLNITGPSDISYIREHLDKIEQGWHEELKRYAVNGSG